MMYLVGLAMVPQWYRDGGISIFKFLLFSLLPIFVWLGMKWFLGSRRVAGYAVVVPPGTRVRILQHSLSNRTKAKAH
jgi:hypothetical protein